MGGRFDITIVAENKELAEKNIDSVVAEISRIENLISDWKSDSQISKVNQNAGIMPVKVVKEVFELTKRALELSNATHGAFDISFAAMDKIWKFDGSMTQMPSEESIKKSVSLVGFEHVILNQDSSTIFLKYKGMKIGFGALGEGYATDKCRQMMLAKGIKAGIVNASGDMSTWGKQPNGAKWLVAITNPINEEKILPTIPIENEAIVTSGNYRKFVEFNGKRYSHIINPKTGYPATGLISVTVIGPSAEIANGLSTSTMVLGKSAGIAFLEKYADYRFILITDKGEIIHSKVASMNKMKLPKRVNSF
ncbi:FAD:protein FMN transferase [Pedobacter jejuensis]|uniref:FAD:protein FMN transferase n=2 Tax=Pedobacter jejuensis TaxID=1268550 RepID=A0A3N0C323_9SPHI|nr:FAD:protein FMN transferase [Pedobacter jejuensis]